MEFFPNSRANLVNGLADTNLVNFPCPRLFCDNCEPKSCHINSLEKISSSCL
jgi:hypothetical protein